MRKTYMAKTEEQLRDWFIVDATNMPLGRLASKVATILRGKHKPTYTPHVDTGDHVIVINASKVLLTGNKLDNKFYHRHTSYPGGLRSISYRDFMERSPEKVIEKAIRGMLPRNTLGRQMYRKLKVYATDNHPHEAQSPKTLEI